MAALMSQAMGERALVGVINIAKALEKPATPDSLSAESMTKEVVDSRTKLADLFWKDLQTETPTQVLGICARKELLTPPILSANSLASVASYIVEVCQGWRWL